MERVTPRASGQYLRETTRDNRGFRIYTSG